MHGNDLLITSDMWLHSMFFFSLYSCVQAQKECQPELTIQGTASTPRERELQQKEKEQVKFDKCVVVWMAHVARYGVLSKRMYVRQTVNRALLWSPYISFVGLFTHYQSQPHQWNQLTGKTSGSSEAASASPRGQMKRYLRVFFFLCVV